MADQTQDDGSKERNSQRLGKADDQALPALARDKIAIGLTKVSKENLSRALLNLFGKVEFGADMVKHIQRGKIYLAEIPKKLQADFDEGKLRFMTLRSGEQVTELVGPNNFGTRGHMILKQTDWIHTNIPKDFTLIATQQQLARMAQVLDEVRSRIMELQTTYDEGLLGELRGMRDQLSQVQSLEDLETQKDLVKGAITQINLTRGKVVQRMLHEMQSMPDVPENTLRKLIRSFWSKSFRSNVESGYGKIQELFGYYLAASQLLAYAYGFLGEKRAYDAIFLPDQEMLRKDWRENLIRSEDIVGVDGKTWYKDPQRYLGLIEKEIQRIFATDSQKIVLSITGDMLLEVMEHVGDGKEEQESEE